MKYKLIMLPQPILVSDDKIKDLNSHVYYLDLEGNSVIEKVNNIENYTPNTKKIIAGIPELPSIDFSALSEEDCNKIEWVDVEKLATNYVLNETDNTLKLVSKYSFKDGFKAAQSLNEKKFIEEDLRKAMEYGMYKMKYHTEKAHQDFIQSLSQPKVFDVEVEMEEICLICKCQPAQSGCAYAGCGAAGSEIQPKITSNNSIKVIKVL